MNNVLITVNCSIPDYLTLMDSTDSPLWTSCYCCAAPVGLFSRWHKHACKHNLTFSLEEVEGAEEAGGWRHPGLRLSRELGELLPGEVDEPGDVTEHQLGEGLCVLVSQPLHEEVWVDDHWLAWAGLLLAAKHTAFSPPVSGETNTQAESRVFSMSAGTSSQIWQVALRRSSSGWR